MVVAPLLIIGAVAVGLFIFKDDIINFFTLGFGSLGKDISEGAGNLAASIQKPFGEAGAAIFEAGGNLGTAEAARQKAEQIKRAERDIELAAKESGFSSVAESNLANDSGAVVIGGEKIVVDFGLIGTNLPTDPSPQFLANPEQFLTGASLVEFKKRFGGQSKIVN